MDSPLVRWLATLEADRLAEILIRRPEALAAPYPVDLQGVATRLQDRAAVLAALRCLCLPAVQVIAALRATGPPSAVPRGRLAAALGRAPDDPDLTATLEVLAQRALVWPDGGALRMSGQLWSAPLPDGGPTGGAFDPRPPDIALVDTPADTVAQAAAAATTALARVSAVLAECAREPVALRKAGGVGSRELRRLARDTARRGDPDRGEDEVRLWLEIGYAAALLGIDEGQVVPCKEYDAWAADEPAARLALVLRGWLTMACAPLMERGGPEPAPAALQRDPVGTAAARLRAELLALAAELPAGRGAAGPAEVTAALRWRTPLSPDDPATAARLVQATWREAHLLGVLARGALSPLGRALLDDHRNDARHAGHHTDHPGDHAAPAATPPAATALAATARRLLPEPAMRARFRADLTAVVRGPADPDLALLLDSAGDRAQGGTGVWRFGPESVRRALDGGHTAGELRDALRNVADGGTLPQSLEDLLADVGRRHGAVRVREVGCVVRGADPALIAEIAGRRALRKLGLTALAPTVLASRRGAAETLAALRAAGYAPVGEDAAGVPTIEPVTRRRASAHGRSMARLSRACRADARADPHDLARALIDARRPADDPPQHTESDDGRLAEVVALWPRHGAAPAGDALAGNVGVVGAVRRHARHLSGTEQRLLATAISAGAAVTIEYMNGDGHASTRMIEPVELDRHLLTAYCHLRGEERKFALDRIESVARP